MELAILKWKPSYIPDTYGSILWACDAMRKTFRAVMQAPSVREGFLSFLRAAAG